MMQSDNAIHELFALLPKDRILSTQEALDRYVENCTGILRSIPAVLYPESTEEVVSIVRMANRLALPLYPVSTGRNWGYGSASPMTDGCIVLDLSRMNRVLDLDPELGIVRLEPGVTQQMLSEYLGSRNLAFMVPTTGGGPECSVLGNALERGFGLTPYADHFSAVMDLEAVLPDGAIYRSVFSELGGDTISGAFKWKAGPYLDGLFCQGNFGIVTKMSVALAPRAERVEGFYFSVRSDKDLEAVSQAVQEVLRALPGAVGGCNLLNDIRVLSMKIKCPSSAREQGISLSQEVIRGLSERHKIHPWNGFGTLYGDRLTMSAAKKLIRRKLSPHVSMLVFLSRQKVARFKQLARWIPFPGRGHILENLATIEKSLTIAEGVPSTAALPLVHWRAGASVDSDGIIDPDQGSCGLLWYAPILPFRARDIRALVTLVGGICRKHGLDPSITLTASSIRCVECTVPLLFGRDRPGEKERALECYRELFEEGRKLGYIPYRTGIQGTSLLIRPESVFWKMQQSLKNAVDPNGIIAPGRYSAVLKD